VWVGVFEETLKGISLWFVGFSFSAIRIGFHGRKMLIAACWKTIIGNSSDQL